MLKTKMQESEKISMANVKIDNLADEIMKGLKEYADLATADLKKSVRKAGNTVRKDIATSAPKDTCAYAKSWSVKKTKETSNTLELTVHSKNRYQLAHFLEHGHAKRGGNIELYTDTKNLTVEQQVEVVLDKYGIFYERSEVWISSEKLYEVMYTFEMEV